MAHKTEIINQHLCELVQKSELGNDDIVSIIDNLSAYLNLKKISDYAKTNNITYNAVLKRIESGSITKYLLFNTVFVIDND